jgi:hypothetical protein
MIQAMSFIFLRFTVYASLSDHREMRRDELEVTESWHFGLSFWMQDDDLVGWILGCGYLIQSGCICI